MTMMSPRMLAHRKERDAVPPRSKCPDHAQKISPIKAFRKLALPAHSGSASRGVCGVQAQIHVQMTPRQRHKYDVAANARQMRENARRIDAYISLRKSKEQLGKRVAWRQKYTSSMVWVMPIGDESVNGDVEKSTSQVRAFDSVQRQALSANMKVRANTESLREERHAREIAIKERKLRMRDDKAAAAMLLRSELEAYARYYAARESKQFESMQEKCRASRDSSPSKNFESKFLRKSNAVVRVARAAKKQQQTKAKEKMTSEKARRRRFEKAKARREKLQQACQRYETCKERVADHRRVMSEMKRRAKHVEWLKLRSINSDGCAGPLHAKHMQQHVTSALRNISVELSAGL